MIPVSVENPSISNKELVQRVLALVVVRPACAAAAARAPDGVDLVEEDDAGRLAAGLLEQLSDPLRLKKPCEQE
jgi:hypothetical protein